MGFDYFMRSIESAMLHRSSISSLLRTTLASAQKSGNSGRSDGMVMMSCSPAGSACGASSRTPVLLKLLQRTEKTSPLDRVICASESICMRIKSLFSLYCLSDIAMAPP